MGAQTLVKTPRRTAEALPSRYRVQFQAVKEPGWYPALFYIYVIGVVPYMAWRLSVINWDVWYGPLVYLAELHGAIMTLLFLWMARRIFLPVHRKYHFNRSVDILIPTYAEPVEVLARTIKAAKKVRGHHLVWVLDDGERPEVAALCQRLEANYLARPSHEFAKAGNLNFGLGYSEAEFLLTLDADHAPVPQFLERVMGYFDDPEVGFVQTPQAYSNLDSFLFRQTKRGLWNDQNMFYYAMQPAKNRWNAAFFVGTSAVLRRSALDSVGGFDVHTATEDIHTSIQLHAKGWRSLYVPEQLAFGLEAASLKEYYKQRRRWAAGSLGLLVRSKDSPWRLPGLSFVQRLNYTSSTIAHLQGVQKLIYFLVPIATVFTLQAPVKISLAAYSLIFIVFLAASLGFTSLYARGTYHFLYTEAYMLANCLAHLAGIKGVLFVQKKFSVSVKSLARREKTFLKYIFWGLLVAGVAGLLQALYLLNFTAADRPLVISSLIFIDLQLVFLVTFFAYLLPYENRKAPQTKQPLMPSRQLAHAFYEKMPNKKS